MTTSSANKAAMTSVVVGDEQYRKDIRTTTVDYPVSLLILIGNNDVTSSYYFTLNCLDLMKCCTIDGVIKFNF